MHIVFEQAIERARHLVLSQVPFIYPAEYMKKHGADWDAMYAAAESLLPTVAVPQLMTEATMLSNMRLAELAGTITLKDLFSNSGWVEGVNAYICANQEECTPVWDFLRALVDQQAQK
jgi:hypothetical protein